VLPVAAFGLTSSKSGHISEIFFVVLSASRDAETLNKDIIIGNYISVVADEYAINHFSQIKFVELAGHYWEVVRVDVQSPRLLITLGSVYNGPTS
jgi:hypothetical protein